MAVARVHWWQADANVHEHVHRTLERIEPAAKQIRDRQLRWARLYGNRAIRELSAGGWYTDTPDKLQLKYNLVRSVVQSWTAKVGKARPRAMFLTTEGDYTARKQAKQMTRHLEGVFRSAGFYKTSPYIARDGAIFGTGTMKVYEVGRRTDDSGETIERGRVTYERTYPWELRVDPIEGWYGTPRTLYQVKAYDRHYLASLFEEHEDEILDEAKTPPTNQHHIVRGSSADMVDVTEAWRLPSHRDGDDGKHVICLPKATLLEEPWKRTRFPFAFYKFEEPLAGWWGDGMVEDLVPVQYELNLSLEKLQACLHLMGVPRWWIPHGSRVKVEQIRNAIGDILSYTPVQGHRPMQEAPPSIPPELPGHVAQLKQDGFEQTGVSRLSAQSQKPAGLNSGRAIREAEDIETERFSIQARAYEEFAMDVAELTVDLVNEITERDGGYEVAAYDHRSAERLDWREIRLDEAAHVMRVFPTGLLPTQPQAKLESVQEMITSGLMSKEDAQRLLDYPDLESVQSLELAAYEIVDQAIEVMIETPAPKKGAPDRGFVPPEPYFPLDFAAKRVTQAYLKAKMEKVPEYALQRLRDFIDRCHAMTEPPPAPPGGPPSASTGGQPAGAAGMMDAGGAPPGAPPLPIPAAA